MSDRPLYSAERAAAGLLVGPPVAPPDRQYKLLERIVPLHDPLKDLKNGRGPTVWRAKKLNDGQDVVVKVVPEGHEWYPTLERGEGARLWEVAGYPTRQILGAELVLSDHPGQAHIVTILDSINLVERDPPPGLSEDCFDACLVLEVLGPSLEEWRRRRPSPVFPLPLVRRLIREVLLALDFLHCQLGFSYGALTLDNVLLRNPFVKLVSFGWGRYRARTGMDGAGDAFHDGHYHTLSSEMIDTPEHWFMNYGEDAGPADAHDSWAVGIITSLLLFNQDLAHLVPVENQQQFQRSRSSRFCREGGIPGWNVTDEGIIDLASLDPDAGWPTWFATSDAEKPDYSGYTDFPFFLSGVARMPNIRERIEATQLVPDAGEADSLASFLRACWTLNPFKRPRAKELLAHEWLRGVE
ncbi:hypothetical protein JCM10449v2_003593 [Rhodotorula kratochvilovae]